MLDYAQLAAMHAVIRTGSFERAARQLGVTPSAVSQRVKALEERVGAILIARGARASATDAGRRLAQHVEEVLLMEHGLAQDLGVVGAGPAPTLRIAVNADSLATWFMPALAGHGPLLFDLVLDNENLTVDWLRRGEVMAAVSQTAGPIQGCNSRSLGVLAYIATASPDFCARWLPEGVTEAAIARAPSLSFSAEDDLQDRWVSAVFGKILPRASHTVPSAQGFIDATLAGLGWAMNPAALAQPLIDAGRLRALSPAHGVTVNLSWHWSRAAASVLAPVTEAVRRQAEQHLQAPR